MALPAWREVALPHEDIRRGRFDESTFAADLADVLAGRGPLEYRDPLTFFRKTYPTKGMVRLLGAVVRRLSGEKGGEPVVQIQTPFGGGRPTASWPSTTSSARARRRGGRSFTPGSSRRRAWRGSRRPRWPSSWARPQTP